jgi:DNA-binding MarR family transcriptional regulator
MKNKARLREIQILLGVAAKTSKDALDARLAAEGDGISSLQYSILQIIRQGPQTISKISRAQMLDPSTLVPSVDGLERAGLAQRTKDPNDRRRTPLVITEKGIDLLNRIPVLDENGLFIRGLEQISPERQEALVGLLRELISNLMGEEAVRGIRANAEGSSE